MLSQEENELITRTGPGTPMGELWRRFWLPALMAWELPSSDCPPVRIRLLSEDLVAFRDSNGQVGLLAENCPHRGASLYFGRNEECGLRCVYHGWKFDVTGQCVDMPSEPAESIDIIPRAWSGPLDPRIHPDKKGFSSRAVIDATRPFEWRDRFPRSQQPTPGWRAKSMEKWGWLLGGVKPRT